MNKLFELIKRIPTPTYGHYGGYYAQYRHCGDCPHPDPIDAMDKVFHEHDHGDQNSVMVGKLKQVSDPELKYKIYGSIYRRAAIALFSLIIWFGVE